MIVKKLGVILMSLIMLLTKTIPVCAATNTQEGIEITLNTNLQSYDEGEKIITVITVKNTNYYTVSDVSLDCIAPTGYQIIDSVGVQNISSLAHDETVTLTVTLIPSALGSAPPTGDNSNMLIWSVLLIFVLAGAVTMGFVYRKKWKGMICMLLCMAMFLSLFPMNILQVSAADDSRSVSVSETVTVGDKKMIVTGMVTYSIPYSDDEADDNADTPAESTAPSPEPTEEPAESTAPSPEPTITPSIEEQLDAAWEARWDNITNEGVKTALQTLYALYDADSLIEWFASLWDNDAGGFYYAHSSRDYIGFEVDLESTYQILNIMQGMGMIEKAGSLPELLGEELTNKIVTYVQSTQSDADGYFYNPQFGTDVSTTRKGRDLEQSIKVLNWLGAEPLYKTALERLEDSTGDGSESSAVLPEHLQSEEALTLYVENLLKTGTQEAIGNTLNGQKAQILAAGLLPVTLDILDKYQDPETGMWGTKRENGTFYTLAKYNGAEAKTQSLNNVLTCAYKIAQLYNADPEQGRAIKYREAYAKTAIEGIVSDAKQERVTYLLNPWASLNNLRANIATFDGDMNMASYSALLAENSNAMLTGLNDKLSQYKKEDGSYSYYPLNSLDTIYGTPVSAGLNEGDVNGTMLAIKSISDAVKGVFREFNTQGINLFNYKHGEALVDAMKANKLPEKQQYYNVSSKFDFSDGTSGAVISENGMTISGLGQTTSADYAVNPLDSTDLIMKIDKTESDTTGTSGGSMYAYLINQLDVSETIEMTAEMDIYIPSDAKVVNENNTTLYQIRVGTSTIANNKATHKYMHMLTINLPKSTEITSGSGFYLGDKKSTSGGKTQNWSKMFSFDTWHKLKLVYTIENCDTTPKFGGVKVYMNDDLIAESKNFYANSFDSNADNKNDIDYGTFEFSANGKYSLLIAPQMRADATLLIDDLTGTVGEWISNGETKIIYHFSDGTVGKSISESNINTDGLKDVVTAKYAANPIDNKDIVLEINKTKAETGGNMFAILDQLQSLTGNVELTVETDIYVSSTNNGNENDTLYQFRIGTQSGTTNKAYETADSTRIA